MQRHSVLSFESFHRLLANHDLDVVAARAGIDSRIGRLSFTPDVILHRLRERLRDRQARNVIDLGCGQGFFGRWLANNAPEVTYFGVDRSASAIARGRVLLPSGTFIQSDYRSFVAPPFDAAVLFDSLFADRVDDAMAAQLARLVCRGGTLFVGVTMLSFAHARELARSFAPLKAAGFEVIYEEWTREVESSVLEMAAAWLREGIWPGPVQEVFRSDARRAIDAILRREFTYATIDARKLR